ncbi:uncharacterized protein [Nicotiana tomentosiformis]|uniref:uncharacterized protein n=1 Tax=Nicotiana tomentosiformis TaxID=4098 RepID=UPI00388C5489
MEEDLSWGDFLLKAFQQELQMWDVIRRSNNFNAQSYLEVGTDLVNVFAAFDLKLFLRWQQKIFFYLTTLSLQLFISKDISVLREEILENEQFVVTEAWKHFDFLCKNYILSCLEDGLYNVYSVMKTSRELWNALEKKYKTEDAGLKKFVAAKFLNFKMVDGKSVITQVQELQVIVYDLFVEGINRVNIFIQDIDYFTNYKFMIEGMVINEAFQVAAFIEKLHPLWKDFKNYLKYKRKEMTLEDLIIRLRIEEDNKAAEKKSRENSTIMGANIVEQASTSKKRKKSSGPKNYPSKKSSKVIAITVERLDTRLLNVLHQRRTKRKVKQT